MSLNSAVCPVRVGRETEVQLLASNAQYRVMTLIAGPAGIGKSRLSLEAVRLAEGLGYSVLVGHCNLDQVLPYAPFVGAIRRRTRTMNEESIAGLFGGSAMLASALLPEVARTVDLPGESPPQEDLFAAIWQLLNRLATPSGCLLLLEDLHWADTDSLRLLTYIAKETMDLPVWLVGTYRDDEIHRRHPLAGVLAELDRERKYDKIALAPLRREELAAMVAAIFEHIDVGEEFVEAMYERTAGNPFFVEELLKVLIERGDVYREAGDWARRDLADIEMPFTVRETLLARARSMSPEGLEVLHLAALAGDRLDMEVLAAAAGLAADKVEEVVTEGLRLQLIAERSDGGRNVYHFRHALTREALADELVGPDRRRAHHKIAVALERVHSSHLDDVAAELADHYLTAGETSLAIQFGLQSARVAAAGFALDEAGRRFERALGLMARDSTERLPVLLEAAAAIIESMDRRLPVSLATEARRLARECSDRVAEVRAMRIIAVDAMWAGDTRRSTLILREAFDLIRGVDDHEEAWVRSLLAFDLTRVDRIDEAMELLDDGIAMAERTSNYRALTSMHVARMMNASFGPGFEESLGLASSAAQKAQDLRGEYQLTQTAAFICLWCGEFARSRELFLRALQLRERVSPHDRYTEVGYAWLLSLMGEYDEAARLSLDTLATVDQVPSRIVALTAVYEVAERRSDPGADSIVEEFWSISSRSGESQRSVPALSARARNTLLNEGLESAGPLFWEVLTLTTSARGRGSHWLFSPDMARALLDEERLEELERWADAMATVTSNDSHLHNRSANALVQAYCATAQGEFDGARAWLGEAMVRYGSMLCPAREAESLIGLSDLERRVGNEVAAAAAATRALVIAERIGAGALIEQATLSTARASVPTILTTVLFTDIVGSTQRLSEVGDRAWRTLLERHNAVVRREMERYGGREVNTTGDGFLASFDSPAQAIRSVMSMREALKPVGVEIRAGLHTGECQVAGDNLAGIAVHLAARVCAAAGSSELLVTGTVRDLVAGANFTFVDRGTHEMKGVAGDWRLFSI